LIASSAIRALLATNNFVFDDRDGIKLVVERRFQLVEVPHTMDWNVTLTTFAVSIMARTIEGMARLSGLT
jgi:hypothetical protein